MSHTAIQLTKSFDPIQLKKAYHSLQHIQSNPAGYPGEGNVAWNSLTLYSLGGSLDALQTHLPDLLSLNLRFRLIRFMVLEPGGIIKKHTDSFLSDRIVRLHIPVVTNDAVEFYLNDERCNWKEGEFWYGDFSKPHEAYNKSDITRIHLVMDVTLDENLLALFPRTNVPSQFQNQISATSDQKYHSDILKRFDCDFTLPTGFSLPGLDYSQLESSLIGKIRLVDEELCILINEQPVLKAVPLTEDKLSLIGLGFESSVDYVFDRQTIKSLTLDMAGTKIPISILS